MSYFILQTKETCAYKSQISFDLSLGMIMCQHIKVLLIDDSELIGTKVLTVLSSIPSLELLGQAKTIKDGLQACKEEKPDIVILDIHLPDGSGIGLLKELKIRFPHIRVIMLTNSADSFYRRRCEELDADHFLDKTKDFIRIPQLLTGCLQL